MKTIAASIVFAATIIAGAILLLTQSGTHAQDNPSGNILQALGPDPI